MGSLTRNPKAHQVNKLETSWFKIVVINLLVFSILIAFGEIFLRSAWTVRSCLRSNCDFSRVAGLKVRQIDRATGIGISRFDNLLGYVPREGFSSIVNAPGLVNANGVDNGGMFGYGAAQALKRAKLVERTYIDLVLSIFWIDDFRRDRLSYGNGFPSRL
jgi:hypothetical protein